jgi:hypothetical protein
VRNTEECERGCGWVAALIRDPEVVPREYPAWLEFIGSDPRAHCARFVSHPHPLGKQWKLVTATQRSSEQAEEICRLANGRGQAAIVGDIDTGEPGFWLRSVCDTLARRMEAGTIKRTGNIAVPSLQRPCARSRQTLAPKEVIRSGRNVRNRSRVEIDSYFSQIGPVARPSLNAVA